MPRIDEMPEFRAQLGRNTHDLSHKLGFTATVAHLMPVFHDFLNPGETVDLSFKYNLRTQPLASAAMVDIKSHVEYFFVPINLLLESFGSKFYNIRDMYSSYYGNKNFDSSNYVDSLVQMSNDLPVLDFNSLLTEMQGQDITVVGFEAWFNHVYRLFDLLGYNNEDMNSSSPTNFNPDVFPYPILAYNCIYQYYYRLDSREAFDQMSFNWDRYSEFGTVDASSYFYEKYIRLFYRPKDDDYFTNVKVSPIVDVLNANKWSLDSVNEWLSRSVHYNYGQSNVDVLSSGGIGNSSNVYGGNTPSDQNSAQQYIQTNFGFAANDPNKVSINSSRVYLNGADINTANIRAIFANEKLHSITGRSRKHYDDQTLAHFGFKVPHDVKHQISCFGHDRGVIHIGEVISTADTANAGLGEIAGKGYGSLSADSHKFTAPCHGVVMAILSFVPDICYSRTYLKANAVASCRDLFMPEYDHLGMQPLFGYEGNIEGTPAQRNSIIGWQYRYEQWKRRYNRVTKAFAGNGNLDSWMLDFSAPQAPNSAFTQSYLEYVHNPSELNQIMLVNYVTDTSGTSITDKTKTYDGDPFVVDGYVYCKKVSSMSDYSLPRLDA